MAALCPAPLGVREAERGRTAIWSAAVSVCQPRALQGLTSAGCSHRDALRNHDARPVIWPGRDGSSSSSSSLAGNTARAPCCSTTSISDNKHGTGARPLKVSLCKHLFAATLHAIACSSACICASCVRRCQHDSRSDCVPHFLTDTRSAHQRRARDRRPHRSLRRPSFWRRRRYWTVSGVAGRCTRALVVRAPRPSMVTPACG